MPPSWRHQHHGLLPDRRRALRYARREQAPIPVWFCGLGRVTYRHHLRPQPHPPVPLRTLARQRLQQACRVVLRGSRYPLLVASAVGLTYGLVLVVPWLWQHLPPLFPDPVQMPPRSATGRLPLDVFMVPIFAVTQSVYLPIAGMGCVVGAMTNLVFGTGCLVPCFIRLAVSVFALMFMGHVLGAL